MSLKRSRLDDAIMPSTDEIEEEDKTELKLDSKKEGEEEEILLTKKKRAVRKQITEGDIAGPDGIQRIYEVFPKLCRFHGRGNEVIWTGVEMRVFS